MQIISISLLVCSALIMALQPAHAYLDPGTGSIIIQAVIGTIVGGLAFLKFYYHRIVAFFSSRKARDQEKNK